MKKYLFIVIVDYKYKTVIYRTNAIMSKNDGALIAFRDESDVMQNYNPQDCRVELNKE